MARAFALVGGGVGGLLGKEGAGSGCSAVGSAAVHERDDCRSLVRNQVRIVSGMGR